jgi:DNA-directed RNA polymerase specialized sigma24 family protein
VNESLWFTTRSTLFQGGGEAWEAVAAYAAPLQRLVGRRYSWLSREDREDLVQQILIEIKETLVERHDRSRGKFRALLQTVVRRRVTDRLRRKTPAALEPLAAEQLIAPTDETLEALDVEASLVEAMSACRDHFTQGAGCDPDVVYTLADRIVHGRSNAEIARREGISVDVVNRRLRRGRQVIYRQLVARQLDLDPQDTHLPQLVEVFRATLRDPAHTQTQLETIPDEALRARTEDFLARFRAGVAQFSARFGEDGEFQRGVSLVLE